MYVVPDWVMVPVEVVPSPQLMVAMKALAGSTPLAWVKVADLEVGQRPGLRR